MSIHLSVLFAAMLVLTAACGSDTTATDAAGTSRFALTSPALQEGGTLPVVYTCDGAGHSPPFAWTGTPSGTTQFALLMTTLANDGMRWNWVLHGIPARATSLAENATAVGTNGLTSDGPNLVYYPPCSQGPGAKTYTFTLYALSAAPVLPAVGSEVTGPVLTSAISGVTIASSQLSVAYTRMGQ